MPSQPPLSIEHGVSHHQAGRLAEAEAIYRQILAQDPDHAQALRLLGIIALQVSKVDVALGLIRRAIAITPNEPSFHSNLGQALIQLNEPHQAATAYRRAIELDSKLAEAHNGLGNALHRLGQSDDAMVAYQMALSIRPEYAEAHLNLAMIFSHRKQWETAIESFRRAIAISPQIFLAHYHLGNALCSVNRLDEAEASFRQAIALKPDSAEAYNDLGSLFQESERTSQAIAEFRIATQLQPDHPVMQYNLGSALLAAAQFDQAIVCLRKALSLRPAMTEAHNNLANALLAIGSFDGAEALFRQTLQLDPKYTESHNNFATLLLDLRRIGQAIAHARKAVELQPKNATMHRNLGQHLLVDGQFEEGWREQEWRVHVKGQRVPAEDDPHPRWDGSDLAGRRILIYAEQGFGDVIQFSRYLPLLLRQRDAGEVIFQVPVEMVSLLNSFSGIRIVSPKQPLPDFDVRCPILSLPLHFGTTLETIPDAGKVPYLRADASKVEHWRSRLVDETRFKVGVAWAGRGEHKNDRNRSIALKLFAPLLNSDSAKFRFFSLQKGPPAQQLGEFPGFLVDWTDELRDFSDSAALLENLDLLISADTAIVHLAGALGRTVWSLLPFTPDWRWLLDRGDSPWYPTMRLFRQPAFGDWPSVIQNVARELARVAG